MRPGPLTVLGIVDHAVDTARRQTLFALSTIVAGSLPLALAAALAVHLVKTTGAEARELLAGSAVLALLTLPRAIGWGAGIVGLQGYLDDQPIPARRAWRAALSRWPVLFTVHAGPLFWTLLGLFATLAPLALAVLAADVESPFRSVAVTLAASAAGSMLGIVAVIVVSRRALALPVAATRRVSSRDAMRRSLDLSRGRTIRLVALQTYLAILQLIVWFTLVQAPGWALDIGEILTGYAFVELRGALAATDASYLAFQGAVAFLIVEPVRCWCAGYFHQDSETRRSGVDLKARLELMMPAPDEPVAAEKTGWRG